MGTTFKGQAVQVQARWTAWPLKVVPIVSPETSVTNQKQPLL